MEYEVLWGDGPLGLTLRPDLGEDMPPVVGRITRMDSAAALASVAVGDMLVAINGVDTARQGYDQVVDLLQKIPRPATLRFRVPRQTNSSSGRDPSIRQARISSSSVGSNGGVSSTSSRRHEQYTVVWTEGPLGMILRPDDDDVHVPCIRKITGKGAGTGMERATVGDVLVAVNGQETKSLGFRSTISLLKTIRKPAVLKFKRMHRRLSRRRSSREEPASSDGIPLSALPSADLGAYDIIWREGDLGLKLKPGHRDVPVLSKLTGKGNASGLQNANVGDELVSVNGILVEGQVYHDTLRMLKHSQKPAILRFRPGKDRRISLMSIASSQSNPGTMREVDKVRSGHVPIYDTGRSSRRTSGLHHSTHSSSTFSQSMRSSSGLSRSTRSSHRRDSSGERVKRKKRIPLDVAKELVAASMDLPLDGAVFAGLPITAIQDGTREAHLLRVEAKLCITKDRTRNGTGLAPKEALQRAEQEALVLQQALEKVKDQAKKYEKLLETQKKESLLALATRNKSKDVIGKQNDVITQLSSVIAGLKRDSYSEMELVPLQLEKDHQELIDDLHNVMNIPAVVPMTKYCAECGVTETMATLEVDADGQYYCKDCWETFLNTTPAQGISTPPIEHVISSVQEASTPPVPENLEVSTPPLFVRGESLPTPSNVSVRGDNSITRLSSNRLSAAEREDEERKARVEAEKQLQEIQEMQRAGSTRSITGRSSNSLKPEDRTRRERRGMEELAQALKEEEERARAEGNLSLAKKLRSQIDKMEISPDADRLYRTSPTPPLDRARSSPVKASNDYADVNSDEEGEDEVDLQDDDHVLREVEDRNLALAKQLGAAHDVVERARMSILEIGEDVGDDEMGLSEAQINLFKKLTTQADERMSTVDRLHPDEESDSDESDNSENEKIEEEEDDDEEEDEDGVWI